MQHTEPNTHLAVLIDAENITNAQIVNALFEEIAKLGTATVKRIYGDWTTPSLNPWKATLLEHSIQPIQQFRYTTGKNSTDSALIIDAMDLLYSGNFAGFCIVSSDSDFTRLASRLRESGLKVYGFEEMKTPKPFVSACDRFIYIEVFNADKKEEEIYTPTIKPKSLKELRCDTKLLNLIRAAISATSDENGWAYLGVVGGFINRTSTDFDPRNYGYAKLGELIIAIGLFEVQRKDSRIFIKIPLKKTSAPEVV